jgi:hypothetical protein
LQAIVLLVLVSAAAIFSSIWSRRRSWRDRALQLYRTNAALWQSQPRWVVIDARNHVPWRAEAAASVQGEIERLGFRVAGFIQDATDRGPDLPRDERVMAILLDDTGLIWAASYEVNGREVIEFESEFADGTVLGTGNNELAARLSWPEGFDIRHESATRPLPTLLAHHRDRLRVRSAIGTSPPVRCLTVDDVVASQDRQQAAKHAFRRSIDFLTGEEFRWIARDLHLSRRATEEVFKEYRRIAEEARRAN